MKSTVAWWTTTGCWIGCVCKKERDPPQYKRFFELVFSFSMFTAWFAQWIVSSNYYDMCVRKRERNMFQGHTPWDPMYYQRYKRKLIHRSIISQHSVLTHISVNIKMATDVKKCISVKGKNVSRVTGTAVMIYTLKLWWLNTEQTTVKQQEVNIQRWKHKALNLRQFYAKTAVFMDPKPEWNVNLVQHHYSTKGWNFKSILGRCA
jgi:hypothetical protein